MEFFLGAFEQEWQRRRAILMHETQLRKASNDEWDELRRAGAGRLHDLGTDPAGRRRWRHSGKSLQWSCDGGGKLGRSMRTRFASLAAGSQPAVVKLSSYGRGVHAAAMISYTSRKGELAVENERGERVLGKSALAAQLTEWEHLFDNRTASRDIAVFHVSVDTASLRSRPDLNEQVCDILRAAFGSRSFVYSLHKRSPHELRVTGVIVLRDPNGERLTGDRKAAEIIQQRYDETQAGQSVRAWFGFRGYGNGAKWGSGRVRDLIVAADREVRDNKGRSIVDVAHAGKLVQTEWRKELHSRKGRDVMHLIVSARAGTDRNAFEGAVREFLGEQFAGHRYVFVIHDPLLDPKDVAEGGKRPHIHAHAIITMRSDTGGRIVTSPRVFRQWRAVMAEKAREQHIDMELTDRRDFASAAAYKRNQVRPLSYLGQTTYEGTSSAAHMRYQAKRSNELKPATTDRSKRYAALATKVWTDLAQTAHRTHHGKFALAQSARLEGFLKNDQIDRKFSQNPREPIISAVDMTGTAVDSEGRMREMTRAEFSDYQRRVESALAEVEQKLDGMDRAEFNEVASVAREIVDIRREYLEFAERQANLEAAQRVGRDEDSAQWLLGSNKAEHRDPDWGRHSREGLEAEQPVAVSSEQDRGSHDERSAERKNSEPERSTSDLPQEDTASQRQSGLQSEIRQDPDRDREM